MKGEKFTTPEGVTYEPFIEGDNTMAIVGFKVTRELDSRVEYVSLVPSSQTGGEGGTGNVFIYHSDADEDPLGEPVIHINFFEGSQNG